MPAVLRPLDANEIQAIWDFGGLGGLVQGFGDAQVADLLLALYLAKGLLPEVRMKDKQHGQIASLTQTRDTLVKLRTALKNKVNNLLSAHGINLPKEALSSKKKLVEVLRLPFEELVRTELRVIVGRSAA